MTRQKLELTALMTARWL